MIMDSSKPRKQRYFRFNAAMHLRQHFVHAHVDKELRARLGLKPRAVQISRGDTVKIMSGSKKGTSGKVVQVNLKTGRIYLDSLLKKNAKGKEFSVGISANNVYITALNLTDKIRAAKLNLKQQVEAKAIKGVPIEAAEFHPASASKIKEVAAAKAAEMEKKLTGIDAGQKS